MFQPIPCSNTCTPGCLKCFGVGTADCITCKEGFQLTAGACVYIGQCDFTCGNSATLNGVHEYGDSFCVDKAATSCKTCRDGYYHEVADTGSVGECLFCPNGCLTCTHALGELGKCTTCNPIGFYKDGGSHVCSACYANCKVCNGPA